MQTREEAWRIGQKVAKQLGQDWKVRIWENVGWHVTWTKGAITVHYEEGATNQHFWCLVGPVNSGLGHLDLNVGMRDDHVCQGYRTARGAIRNAVREAQECIVKEWIPIIDSLEEIKREMAKPTRSSLRSCGQASKG